MHAEFLQDDCDNIWFTYARSIHFRRMARNRGNEMLAMYMNQNQK